ncbi:hypothetical protein EDB85DRAFT_1902330 [Lactarius pseudohatsudake]|nr:hypothetical protein EDB85DRAFT_1902330 [Lactarius pseudohatsudake]
MPDSVIGSLLDGSLYRMITYDNLIVGIVYGIYSTLRYLGLHPPVRSSVLSKEGRRTLTVDGLQAQTRMIMFGITTFMFTMGVIALVLEITLWFQQYHAFMTRGGVWSPYRTNVAFAVESTITRLMYVLSDIICAWRAVVLWNRDKRIIAILLLLILGTTAVAGYELYFSLAFNFSLDPTGHYVPYYDVFRLGTTGDSGPLIMVGPTLGTNLVSTGLIAWKAWQHRVSVRKYLGKGSGSVRAERILALLIESSFIYCCFWVVYLISALNVIHGFIVMEHVLLFVSGLYPTLIIILVAMQKSPIENYSTYSTGMQFATGPALRRTRAGDKPRLVCTICREYASDSDTHTP